MDARMLRPDPMLHALIRQLPFPMVLFGTGADCGLANDRFSVLFHAGQVDGPELQRLTHQAGAARSSSCSRSALANTKTL